MLVDEFLPVYDVSDAVAGVIEADVATTWDALMNVDLIEVGRRRPLVAALGALRSLPDAIAHLVQGHAPPAPPRHLRFCDIPTLPPDQGGWVLLGARPREEMALGLVGKFWRPVIVFAKVAPEAFRTLTNPDMPRRSTRYSCALSTSAERSSRG